MCQTHVSCLSGVRERLSAGSSAPTFEGAMRHTQRAWAFDAERGLRLEEVPLPPLQAGWARCQVTRVQPSIFEALTLTGRAPAQARGSFSYGHEFAARIVTLAPPASADLVGARVVCPPAVPCGICRECLEGHPARCLSRFRLGKDTAGAFGEFVDLPAAYLLVLSDRVSDLAACCAQPAASAVANLVHGQIPTGARVLILGQGVMGLLSLQAAAAQGAAAVLTTARRPSVRALSQSLGAEVSLDPDDPTTLTQIGQFRPDFVIDAAGGPRSAGLAGNSLLEVALDVVMPYGTVLELSDLSEPLCLSPRIREKSLRLVFGQWSYYYGVYPYTLAMLGDGRIKCGPLVTHEVRGLENLPEVLEIKVDRVSSGAIQVQLVLD